MARRLRTLEEVEEQLRPLFSADQRVVAAYVFGSLARGDSGSLSDVDVGVLLRDASDVPLLYKPELLTAIMQALGRDDVDLVILNNSPAFLKHRILRDGVCFFERDRTLRSSFQARAYSEYFDLQPFLDRVYSNGSSSR